MNEDFIEDANPERDEEDLDFNTIYQNIKKAFSNKNIQELLEKIGISEDDTLKELESENLIYPTEQDTEKSFSKKFLKHLLFKRLLQKYQQMRLSSETEISEETSQLNEDEIDFDKNNETSDKESFFKEFLEADEQGDISKMLKAISTYQLFPFVSKDKIFPTKLTTVQKNELVNYVTNVEYNLDKRMETIAFENYETEPIQETEAPALSDEDTRQTTSFRLYMDYTDFTKEQARRWDLEPAATIQAHHEKPTEPIANFLTLNPGEDIQIALQDLTEFKSKGIDIRTNIQGIMIDTRECEDALQVVELFNTKKDEMLQGRIDALIQECETLDFSDSKASIRWIREFGHLSSQMSKAPDIDKAYLKEFFEQSGIDTEMGGENKFDFYSSDINETNQWVKTVAARQILKDGRITPELTERAQEVLILQKESHSEVLEEAISPDNTIQNELSNLVSGTIIGPDGKPNEKGMDSLRATLQGVITQRQQEINPKVEEKETKSDEHPYPTEPSL